MSININIDQISTTEYRTDCFTDYSLTGYHIRNNSVYNGWYSGYQKMIDVAPISEGGISELGYCATMVGDLDAFRPHNPFICDKLLWHGEFGNYYEGYIGNDVNQKDVTYSLIKFHSPILWLDGSLGMGTQGRLYSGNFYLIDELQFYSGYYTSQIAIVGKGQRYVNGNYTSLNAAVQRAYYNPSLYNSYNFYLGAYQIWSYTSILEFLNNYRNTEYIGTEVYRICQGFVYGALVTYAGGNADTSSDDVGIVYSGININTNKWATFDSVGWGDYSTDFTHEWRGDYWIFVPFISQDEYNAACSANYKWNDNVIQQINQYVN